MNVVGSQVNQANQTVTAPLAHLSPYAVLQPAAANQLPIAALTGPSTGTVGEPLTFSDNNSSDPDGGYPLSFSWTVDNVTAGTSSTLTRTFNAIGTYIVKLTVEDTQGGSASDSIEVTISTTPNLPPVAHLAGPQEGTVGLPLTFSDNNSSDPDGGYPLSLSWTVDNVAAGTGPTLTRTFNATGTHTITLTVADTQGGSASDSMTVTISPPSPTNQAPVAMTDGPYVGTVNQVIPFSAASSYDPDGDPLTYAWDFGDGATGSGASVTHYYTTAATFIVKLTVTDTANASNQVSTTATISPPVNQQPTALMKGPSTGTVDQVLTFSDDGSSDPEGGVLTYAWDFGDTGTASGPSTTHSYATAGTFTVTLTVTDPDGASGSDSKTVTISPPGSTNHPPTITSLTVPPTGLVLQNMVLKGSGSDIIDGDPLTYTWEFGDGSPNVSTATAGVVHEFQTAGSYKVTFTVDDGKGGSASTTRTIAITLPSSPVAFAHSRTIPMRQSQALYLNQHAIDLDGSGVPPLRFTIVSPPTHFPYDLTTGFDMTAGDNYQWWDPVVNKMRLECRRQTGIPAYCYATESSHAENTTSGLVADPINRTLFRSTVLYTPERCWYWTGPWVDTFSFTVTDATGATSAPATVTINVNPNTICVAPSF